MCTDNIQYKIYIFISVFADKRKFWKVYTLFYERKLTKYLIDIISLVFFINPDIKKNLLQGDLKHKHFIILTVHDLGCNCEYLSNN